MSLDVYLTLPDSRVTVPATVERIFVRRDGTTVEVTRAEWDEMYPGREPVVMADEMDGREVYTGNITHNMAKMALEAGLYEVLWRPDEHGYERAGQLIMELRAGLGRLLSDRAHYEQFNPKNGWGDYDGLVRFAENYLAACEEWPDAEVQASG